MEISSFKIPTASEYPVQKYSDVHLWELYTAIKKARPKLNTSNEDNCLVDNLNASIKKTKLNNLANLITGHLLFDILNEKDYLNVVSITWEYKISEYATFNYENELNSLINDVGSLKNIPGFILGQFKELDEEEFNSRFAFLGGTTFSFRLKDGSKNGMYFCLPSAALYTDYLIKFIKKCDIEIPNFSHVTNNPKTSIKHRVIYEKREPLALNYEVSYEALFNQMMKFGMKAKQVIKGQYLAKR